MVLLLANVLYNTIEYPRFVKRMQQYPDWMSLDVRRQLQNGLRQGESVITNPRSSLPHTWLLSQKTLPRDWEQVREMASKVEPPPGGCDMLVGVGHAGGVLADAIASAWTRDDGPAPPVTLLQAPVLSQTTSPIRGQRVMLVDGYGLSTKEASELLEASDNVVVGRASWKSMNSQSYPSTDISTGNQMLFPFV